MASGHGQGERWRREATRGAVGEEGKGAAVEDTSKEAKVNSTEYFARYELTKIRREWHDNGQIAIEWTYTDGREDKGTVTFFHANGKVRHTFKSGGKNKHPNQVTTTWYDNGVKESEGRWRNELQHGKWTFWYRSGKRQRVTTYKEGQPDGWSTEWDEKGKVVSKKRFKNGKLVKK